MGSLHLVSVPQFGQRRRDICDPTKVVERYTNLGYLQPAVSLVFRRLGINGELAGLGALDGFLGKRLVVHPPLRFEYRFDDTTRFTITIGVKVSSITQVLSRTHQLTRRFAR